MAAGGIDPAADARGCFLQSFRLYQTISNFYMIGRNKSRTMWRVLKIDRSEHSELNIFEDPTTYSESECYDMLMRIHEGNRSTGGLKFVTNCYGIIGFVKFLGPYYMLLITKRRKIGDICGHIVYAISKREVIAIPNSTVQFNKAYSKDENRYKKLLHTVDLTKDFFFSYSYHIMFSLQKNFCDGETGQVLYETMFVWNEFLTRGIRNNLKNNMWTVALVYGFFKQAKLSISGKDFKLTLIARRSRHYAGTRYLKRGVNEKGRVANDVETEQIVFEDTYGEIPSQISSVVQNRGSIPLYWSQETSWLNIKPDMILHNTKDPNYEATRLHFENLVRRYGNPIIILNLIKTREKKPRESILRAEFAKAIAYLNKELSEENHLRFLHLDLHRHSRRKATNVLALLCQVAANALDITGFFYCQGTPSIRPQSSPKWPTHVVDNYSGWPGNCHNDEADEVVISYGSQVNNKGSSGTSGNESSVDKTESDGHCLAKEPIFQRGVLRTNCIDCLDRTNVAQFAYGLAALGRQLHTLGFINISRIDLDDRLADELMHLYERMGDTLALQYGGSAAHNKIFSERRGQWKAAIQSQEFFRTIQRYCSNTYMDAEKQDAINVFLGHFQAQEGRPALWEMKSDQYYNVGRHAHTISGENPRSFIKRSMSDGNILSESNSPVLGCITEQKDSDVAFISRTHHVEDATDLSDSLPEMPNEFHLSNSRHNAIMFRGQLLTRSEDSYDAENCSNFLNLDWLSSSGNSLEEDIDRSSLINSPVNNLSTENIMDGITAESTTTISEKGGEETDVELSEFPDSFAQWVANGSAFQHCCQAVRSTAHCSI